jgi:CheY-like chemotaxis protein
VLVVEDESLVFWMVEDMLRDLGCEIAASASSVREALVVVETGEFDIALLDVNLAGEKVFPVAEALLGRAIPFVFTTGYGIEGIREDLRKNPVIAKPFTAEDLEKAMFAVLTTQREQKVDD